jgi:predicted transcriptional regulator
LIAQELISTNLPQLHCDDTGRQALNIMESFRISHLPVVKNHHLVGIISDKDIYDRELETCTCKDSNVAFLQEFVYSNQHIFEIVQKMHNLQLTVMPVLSVDKTYLGAIIQPELALHIIKMFSSFEPGAVIVLEISPLNFSLSQISQIVESNDAKILSMYTHKPANSNEFDVTLKLNITEISSIIQTFVRYDYNIKAAYMDDSLLNNMYNERYEMFMKYIDM